MGFALWQHAEEPRGPFLGNGIRESINGYVLAEFLTEAVALLGTMPVQVGVEKHERKREMAGTKFPWGKVLETFEFDFDGAKLEVVKFHPWKSKDSIVLSGQPDEQVVHYHCEEIHESFVSFDALLISWITHRRLGLNQRALAAGICKALDIVEDEPDR